MPARVYWTSFEYKSNAMTGNGNYVNLLKLASSELIFGGF